MMTDYEVGPAPRGGWTAYRTGTDEKGPFEEYIGQVFATYAEAEKAANAANTLSTRKEVNQ